MKIKTSKKIRGIITLMIIVWIALIFSQLDLLKANIKNQRSYLQTNVDNAMHRAATDINFRTFELLKAQKPELIDDLESSDTTSVIVQFANELQIEKWKSYSVIDFINMHKQVKELNFNYDYLDLGVNTIDSIIRSSLKKENIDHPCEIGIYSIESNKFIYLSSEKHIADMEKSTFRHRIFALKANGETRLDELVLFFPNVNFKLWTHNFSYHFYLIFILLVVLFCFISTISIIRKQDEIDKLKTNFVNSMTHEIKTPVATISLACQTLQDESIKKNETMLSTYLVLCNI